MNLSVHFFSISQILKIIKLLLCTKIGQDNKLNACKTINCCYMLI